MKTLQQLFSAVVLLVIALTAVSCSSDDEVLSVEGGMTGTWEVASEQFLIDGEDLNIPRSITKVPAEGSTIQFNADKSLLIMSDTTVSNNAWRAGADQNLFIALQDENVETEFAVRSLTHSSVTLYHIGEGDLNGDGNLNKIEIIIGLTRAK